MGDYEDDNDIINKAQVELGIAKDKFAKIQENPALYGAENGLTDSEHALLEKLIAQVGEANLAADAILRRAF